MDLKFSVINNQKIHYFDYAATTFMPEKVMDKWREFHLNTGIFVGRGSGVLNKNAEIELKNDEEYLRNFFNISDEYQNIYAKNVTEAINIVALSLEDVINPLDIIVVGPFEHHSNYIVWRELAKKRKALFFELPINKDGSIDYTYIYRNRERIKILAISAVSNAFGYKVDIKKIANNISDNTILLVDESQVVAHSPIETDDRISGYFLPSHKMYGPKNIAMASIKKTLISKMKPVIMGGGMVKTVAYDIEWLDENKKFFAGTMDIGLLSAWVEACKYIKKITYDQIAKTNERYSKIIKQTLVENGFKLIQFKNNSVNSIISFSHQTMHAHDINEYLSSKNILIRSGNICSQNSLRKIESNAINRISLGLGVTDDDVNCLCNELKNIASSNNINIYSQKIQDLLSIKQDKLIIPDLILDKEGIACGDKIIVCGELDDGVILFKFDTACACNLTKAVCNYLQKEFNDKNYDLVIKQVLQLKNKIEMDHDVLYKLFDLNSSSLAHRFDCLFEPIKLFEKFLHEISNVNYNFTKKPDTHYNMACDACTSACRINWNHEIIEDDNHDELGVNEYPQVFLEKWLPLGKIVLNEKEKSNLITFSKDMAKIDYKFLLHYKIDTIVFKHILDYCPNSVNENWKFSSYLIQKNEITTKQFDSIIEHISSKDLKVYPIKGYNTKKYYTNPYLRMYSDFDLIAKTDEDAFNLIIYLLKNGFTIRPNVFSIKTMNYNGRDVVTGHFHLQKILDDMFTFELDIAFPGFPINRVEIFYPTLTNKEISTEDQIIISILHLFKHSDVYMKDLNDLFYMLNSDINLESLKNKIEMYNLTDFFSLAVLYIFNEYPVDIKKFNRIIESFNIDEKILNKYPSWPYNIKQHYKIKKNDFDLRTIDKKEVDRVYLFPAVVFVEKFKFETITNLNKEIDFEFEKILDEIYKIKYMGYTFFLTSIGIFIDSYIDTKKINRREYLKALENFLNIIDKHDFYSVSYASKHFKVKTI